MFRVIRWSLLMTFLVTFLSALAFAGEGRRAVIFVIDKSVGMEAYQARLAKAAWELLNGLDFQTGIFVYGADLGAEKQLIGLLNSTNYISPLQVGANKLVYSAIASPASRTSAGSSVIKVIDSALSQLNKDFTSVDIILLSNKDDDQNAISPEIEHQQQLRLEDRLEREIRVTAIVIRPGDTQCLYNNRFNSLDASSPVTRGKYGVQFARMSTSTDGLVINICSDDYASELKSLNDSIVAKPLPQK